MATDAPTTGAPAGAPEITGRSVSTQAANAGILIDQITTMIDCVRRFADDMAPIEDKAQLHYLSCICCMAETIDLVAAKARDVLETIELDAGRLQPKGA